MGTSKIGRLLKGQPQLSKEDQQMQKRIDEEMADLAKCSKVFVDAQIEKGYLTGNLKFLGDCVRNAVNSEVFKRETYFEMCRLRKKEAETALKDLRLSSEAEQAETAKMMNGGYQ